MRHPILLLVAGLALVACPTLGPGHGAPDAADAPADDAAIPGAPDGSTAGPPDGGAPSPDASSEPASCSAPDPAWLLCEDFEKGAGDFDAWLAQAPFLDGVGVSDRGRVTLSADAPHSGGWAAFMPAAAASGYQGASLDWYACDGAPRTNCPLRSFDELHLRAFVRFAPTHQYVHHFLSLGGSQPDDFWYHGTAGCLPNGSLHMGTTVDHKPDTHESFFYTYFPEMGCDTRCERYMDVQQVCTDCAAKGLPTCDVQPQCCWGAEFAPVPAQPFPLGRWFCLELAMHANTPGQHDGWQRYWIDGALGHEVTGLAWRTSPTLALNRARVQHYIETGDAAGHENPVWFDDVVVSTQRVGCERF